MIYRKNIFTGIISLVVILFPILTFAQLEANNFKVTSEGRVIWQKIYEDGAVYFDDLINTVNANHLMYDVQITDEKITCLAEGIKTNPGALGYSSMSTSFYALGNIKAHFTIDFKEGRYRITAVNISTKTPVMHLGNRSLAQDPDAWQYTPLEESVGNGKGLKKKFIKRESIIMSAAIEKEFQIIKDSSIDDNW